MRLSILSLALLVLAGCSDGSLVGPDGSDPTAPITAGAADVVASFDDGEAGPFAVESDDPQLSTLYGIGTGTFTRPDGTSLQCGPTVLHTVTLEVSDGDHAFQISIPGQSLREGTFEVGKRHGAVYPTGCVDRDDVVTSTATDLSKPNFVYVLIDGTLTIERNEDGEFVGALDGRYQYREYFVSYTNDELDALPVYGARATFEVAEDLKVEDLGGPPTE